MSAELWKSVVGWEGVYEISNLGALRKIKRPPHGAALNAKYPRIVRPGDNGDGYLITSLRDGPQRVSHHQKIHQLVAEAFIGPRPRGYQVNHIDRNRKNNAATNLEYVTPQQNTIHGYKSAERRAAVPRGEKHGMSKLTPEQVIAIRAYLKYGWSLADLGRKYGVTPQLIFRIRNGIIWKHLL